MKKTKRLTPILPKELETRSFTEALDDHYISNCRISAETIDFNTEEALHIDRVVFENVTFLETSWPRSEFVDVVFLNCDLSNMDMSRAVFHRTEFRNSKLMGTNFAEAGIRHTLFEECTLNYAAFGFTLCNTVSFVSSTMRFADFYEMELKSSEFQLCDLNDINFTQTSLNGIDLSTNTFESVQVSIDKLQGCTVSTDQAIAFARQMGMIIAND